MSYEELLVIGTFAGVAAAFLALRQQRKNDKNNLKMRALNLVFEKMNDDKKRYAREMICSAYYRYLLANKNPIEYSPADFKDHPVVDLVKLDSTLRPYVESVKADFTQIAIMVHYELIDESAYFDAFWGSMLRCYAALHGNIEAMRVKSGTKHYTTKFQKQCEERALKYWQEKHADSKIIYYSF